MRAPRAAGLIRKKSGLGALGVLGGFYFAYLGRLLATV
jgi:hypothetical protein